MSENPKSDVLSGIAERAGVLDQLPVPVACKDCGGNYTYCNQAFADLMGHLRQEVLGHSVSDFVDADFAGQQIREDQEVLRTGKARTYEVDLLPLQGEPRIALVHKAPILDSAGEMTGISATIFDITEARRTEFELIRSSQIDSLTGAYNRRGGMARLTRICNGAIRDNQHFVILMVDLDHFKEVNDQHGHPAGDEVLQLLVKRLTRDMREYDLCMRYGGDEMLLALPGVDEARAREIAERLRSSIESEPFNLNGDVRVTITASFGIACFPGSGWNREELIRAADKALYQAKNSGRNRVCVAGGRAV